MSSPISLALRQAFESSLQNGGFAVISAPSINDLASSQDGLLNLVTAQEMASWLVGHSLADLTWQALNALSNVSLCADDTRNPPDGTALAGSNGAFVDWVKSHTTDFQFLDVATLQQLSKTGSPIVFSQVNAALFGAWLTAPGHDFGDLGLSVLDALGGSGRLPLQAVSASQWEAWVKFKHNPIFILSAGAFAQIGAGTLNDMVSALGPIDEFHFTNWLLDNGAAGFAQLSAAVLNALFRSDQSLQGQEELTPAMWVQWAAQNSLADLDPAVVAQISAAAMDALAGSRSAGVSALRSMSLDQVDRWVLAHPLAAQLPPVPIGPPGIVLSTPVAMPAGSAVAVSKNAVLPPGIGTVLPSDVIDAFAGIWIQAMAAGNSPSAQQVHTVPDLIAATGSAAVANLASTDILFAACFSSNGDAALAALRRLSGAMVTIDAYRSTARTLDIWAKTAPVSPWSIDVLLALELVNRPVAGPPPSLPAGGVSVNDVNLAPLWSRGQFALQLSLGRMGDIGAPALNALAAHNPVGVLNLITAQQMTAWLSGHSLAGLDWQTLNALSDTTAGAGTANLPVGTALAGLATGNTLASWMAAHPGQFRNLTLDTLEVMAGGPDGAAQFAAVTADDLAGWLGQITNYLNFSAVSVTLLDALAAGNPTGNPLRAIPYGSWWAWSGAHDFSLRALSPLAFGQIDAAVLSHFGYILISVTRDQLAGWLANPANHLRDLPVSVINLLWDASDPLGAPSSADWLDWANHDQVSEMSPKAFQQLSADTLDYLATHGAKYLAGLGEAQVNSWLTHSSNRFADLSAAVLAQLVGATGHPLSGPAVTGQMWGAWAAKAGHSVAGLPDSVIAQISPQAMHQMVTLGAASAFLQSMTAAQFAAWSAPSAGNIQQLSVADLEALAASRPSLVRGLSLDSVNAWIAARSPAEAASLNNLMAGVINDFSTIWVKAMEAHFGSIPKSLPSGTPSGGLLTQDQITAIPSLVAASSLLSSSVPGDTLFAASFALSPSAGNAARTLLSQAIKLHQLTNLQRYLSIAEGLDVFAGQILSLAGPSSWIPAVIVTLEVLYQNSGPQPGSGSWPAGGVSYDDISEAPFWDRGRFSQELQTKFFADVSAAFLNDLGLHSTVGVLNLVSAGDFYKWLGNNHSLSSLSWQALNALADTSVGAGTASPPDGTALAALGILQNNFASWMAAHRADFRKLQPGTLEALASGPAGAAQFTGLTKDDMTGWLAAAGLAAGSLSATLLNALASGNGLQAFTPETWIAWLSQGGHSLSALSPRAFARLGGDTLIRIAGQDPQWLGAVTQTQFAAWLAGDGSRLNGLTMAVITGLAGAGQALQALSADNWLQVAVLNGKSLSGLPVQVIAGMSAASLNDLASGSPSLLAGITKDQFNAWLGNQANQFQDLSLATLNALTNPGAPPLQAASLTPALWAAWAARPGHALAQLTPPLVIALTVDQLNSVADQTPALLSGLTTSQLSALDFTKISLTVMNALGQYNPALLGNLTTAQFTTWSDAHDSSAMYGLSAAALNALLAGQGGAVLREYGNLAGFNAWLSAKPQEFSQLTAETLNSLSYFFGTDSTLDARQLTAWFAAHPDPGGVALRPVLLNRLAASPAAAGLAAMSAYQMDATLALPNSPLNGSLSAAALNAIAAGQGLAEMSLQQFHALSNAAFMELNATALGGLAAAVRAQITAAEFQVWAQAAPQHRLGDLGPAALVGWSADRLNQMAAMTIGAPAGPPLLAGVTAAQFRAWLDTTGDDISQLSPAALGILAQGWDGTGANNALAAVGTAEFSRLDVHSLSAADVNAMLANPDTTITGDQVKAWFDAVQPDPSTLGAAVINLLYSRADLAMPAASFWGQWLSGAAAGATGLNQGGDLSPAVISRIAAGDLATVLAEAPVLAGQLSRGRLQAWLDTNGSDAAHRQALLNSLPPAAVNALAANRAANGVTAAELTGWIDSWLGSTSGKSLVDGQSGFALLSAALLNAFGGILPVNAQSWADWATGTAAGADAPNSVADLAAGLLQGMSLAQLQSIVQDTPSGTAGFAAQMTAGQFKELFANAQLSSQTIQASTLYALAAGGVDGALGGLSAAQWSQWLGTSHTTAIWGSGGPDLQFLTVLALLPQPAGQANLLSLLTGADVKAAADANGGWNHIPFPVLNGLSPATLADLKANQGFNWAAWSQPYTVDGQTVQNSYGWLSAANLNDLYGSQAWPALQDGNGTYDPTLFSAWAAVPGNSLSQVPAVIFDSLPATFFDGLGAVAIAQVQAAQWQSRDLSALSAQVINAIDPAAQHTLLTSGWLAAWLGQAGQGTLADLAPSVVAGFNGDMLNGLSPTLLATLGYDQMQAWCAANSLADLSNGTLTAMAESALQGIPAIYWNTSGKTLDILGDGQFAAAMTATVLNGLDPALIASVSSGQWSAWTGFGNAFGLLDGAAVKAVTGLTAADLLAWLGGNDLGVAHTTGQLLSNGTLPANIATLIGSLSPSQVDALPAGAFDSQAWGVWLGSQGRVGFQSLSADTVRNALAVLAPRPDFSLLVTAWALQPGHGLDQLGSALVAVLTPDSPLLGNPDVNSQITGWSSLFGTQAVHPRFLAGMTAMAIDALPDAALAALTEEDWQDWLTVPYHQVGQLSGRVLNSLVTIRSENDKIADPFAELVSKTIAKGWGVLLSPDMAMAKNLNATFINSLDAASNLPIDRSIAAWVEWGRQPGNSLGQLTPDLFNNLFVTANALNGLASLGGAGANPLLQLNDSQWTAWLGKNPDGFQDLDLSVVNAISATVLATVAANHWTQWKDRHPLDGISSLSANVLNGAARQFTITADGLHAWAAQPANSLTAPSATGAAATAPLFALSANVFNAMTVGEFAKLSVNDLTDLALGTLGGIDRPHWTAWGKDASLEAKVLLSPDSLAGMQAASPATVQALLGAWLAGSPLAASPQARLDLLSGAVVSADWIEIAVALGGADPVNALAGWAGQTESSLADLGTKFITSGYLTPAQWQQLLDTAGPAGLLASQLSGAQWQTLEKRMEKQLGVGSPLFRQIFNPAVINAMDGTSLAAISARWTTGNAPAFTSQDLVQWQPATLNNLAGTAIDLLFAPPAGAAWVAAHQGQLVDLSAAVLNHMAAARAALDSAGWQTWASQAGHDYNQLSGQAINQIMADAGLSGIKAAILSDFGPADWSDVAANGGNGLGDLDPSVVAGFSVDTMNSLMNQAVGQLTAQQLQAWFTQQKTGWADLGIPVIESLNDTAFASISAAGWQALAQRQGLSDLSAAAFSRISGENLAALASAAGQFQPTQLFAWMVAHPQANGVVPGVGSDALAALAPLWSSYSATVNAMDDKQKAYFQSMVGSLSDIGDIQSTVQAFKSIWDNLGATDRGDLLTLLSLTGSPLSAAALVNTLISLKEKYSGLTYADLVNALPGTDTVDIRALVDKLMVSFSNPKLDPVTRGYFMDFFKATPPGIARLILLDQLSAPDTSGKTTKGEPPVNPQGTTNVISLNEDRTDINFQTAIKTLTSDGAWASGFQNFTSVDWKGSQISVGVLIDPLVSMLNENVFFRTAEGLAMYGMLGTVGAIAFVDDTWGAPARARAAARALELARMPANITFEEALRVFNNVEGGRSRVQAPLPANELFFVANRAFLMPIGAPGSAVTVGNWSNERLLLLSKVMAAYRDHLQLWRLLFSSVGLVFGAGGYAVVNQNADTGNPFYSAQAKIYIANGANFLSVFTAWIGGAIGATFGQKEKNKEFATALAKWFKGVFWPTKNNLWSLMKSNEEPKPGLKKTLGGDRTLTPQANFFDKTLYWLWDQFRNVELKANSEPKNISPYLAKIPQFAGTVVFRGLNAAAYNGVSSSSDSTFSDAIRRQYGVYWNFAYGSNVLMGISDIIEMWPYLEGSALRTLSGALTMGGYFVGSMGNSLGAAALAKAAIDAKVENGVWTEPRGDAYKRNIDIRVYVLFGTAALQTVAVAALALSGSTNPFLWGLAQQIAHYTAVGNLALLGDFTAQEGIDDLTMFANQAVNLGCGVDAGFLRQLADDEEWTYPGAAIFYNVAVGTSDSNFLKSSGIYANGKALQRAALQRMSAVSTGETFDPDLKNSAWAQLLSGLQSFYTNDAAKGFSKIQVLYACAQDFSLNNFHASVSGMYQYTYDPSQNDPSKQLVLADKGFAFASTQQDWSKDDWAGITQAPAGYDDVSRIHERTEFAPVGNDGKKQFILVGRDVPTKTAGSQDTGLSTYDGWIRVDLRSATKGSVVVDNADRTVFMVTGDQESFGNLTIYDDAPGLLSSTDSPYVIETPAKSLQDLTAQTAGAAAVPLLFDVVPADGGIAPQKSAASATSATGNANGLGIDFYYQGDASHTPFDLDSLDLPDGAAVTFHSAATGGDYFDTTGKKVFVSGGGDDTVALGGDGNYAQVGLGAQVALEGNSSELMVDGDALAGRDGAFISDGYNNSLQFNLTSTNLTFDNVFGMVTISATTADGARHQAIAHGFDVLWGGQGNDVYTYDHIDGSILRDASVFGGDGNDLFNMSYCNQLDIKTGSGRNTVDLLACTDTLLETSADDVGDTIRVAGGSTLQAQLFGNDDVACDGNPANDVTLDISGGTHRITLLGDSATVSIDGTVKSTTTIVNGNVNGNGGRQGEVVGFTGVQASEIGVAYDQANNRLEMVTLDAATPGAIISDLWINGGLDDYTDCAVFAPNPMPVAGAPTGGQAVFHFAASHLVDSLAHLSAQDLAAASVTVGSRQMVLMSSLI